MPFQYPNVVTGSGAQFARQVFNLDWLSVNSGSRTLGYPYISKTGQILYDNAITAAALADFSGAPSSFIQDRQEALAILAGDIWGHIAHKYTDGDPTFFAVVNGSFVSPLSNYQAQ